VKPIYFTVPQVGVGRKDYSETVEFASEASFKGHQRRDCWVVDYSGVPTIPFPFSYAVLLQFWDAAHVVVVPAPDIPYHIYKVTITTGRAALTMTGLYRFASLADAYIWNVERWYGDTYGYGKAELVYTNGIKTEQGKVYCVSFAEYSEMPTFDFRMTVNGLHEEVLYG